MKKLFSRIKFCFRILFSPRKTGWIAIPFTKDQELKIIESNEDVDSNGMFINLDLRTVKRIAEKLNSGTELTTTLN